MSRTVTPRRRTGFWRAALCVALAVAGCRGAEQLDSDTDATEADVARTETERGPLRVVVQVEPHPARLSDELTLTLTLDYELGVQVVKPPFGEAVGDFLVREFREPLPATGEDREIVRQIYTLEPMRTGQLQIDPIAVTFTDHRPNGDGKQRTVETEALAVEVTSMIEGDAPTLADLREPAGPVELPEPDLTALWLGAICSLPLLLAAAAAALALVVARGRTAATERALSPQELAYLELQWIIDQKLSEHDVKQFYVELTGVVRRYIERTTGIHAPEQTTEEFLQEIGASTVFSGTERDRLARFLESADLVKFAAHQPAASDMETTFERAQTFLGLADREVET